MAERSPVQLDEPVANRLPSLFRSRDYVAWWTGNTVSALGSSISTFAYPLLVLFATGSVAKAGLIGSANLIGMLISMLWGGALADRVSRRMILVAGPVLQAVVLGCVTILVSTHRIQLPVLAVAALLSGVIGAVVLGPSTPALRRIVPKEQLPTASAQALSRDMAVELLGNPVSGFLFAIARALPFGADAVSYLFASAGAALIRRPLGPDRAAGSQNTMRRDIADGLRFVRHQPFLRFVIVFGSLLNTTSAAFVLLLVALVKYRGGGPTQIGFVTAAAVAGGLAGAIAAPLLLRKLRARLLVNLTMWSYTVSIPLVAFVPALWQIAPVLFVSCMAASPVITVVQSYATRIVPDEYVGREAAVGRFGAYALMWTGPLIAGGLVTLFGIQGGVLALLVMVLPLTIAVHISKSLAILNIPIGEVQEASLPDRGGTPVTVPPVDTATATVADGAA